jgi:CIC family chloride channel protein
MISIPVVDVKNTYVGILYFNDIINLNNEEVKKYTKPSIAYIHIDSSAEDAWEVMNQLKSSWAPVVEKGRFLGVVTMNDILNVYKKLSGNI